MVRICDPYIWQHIIKDLRQLFFLCKISKETNKNKNIIKAKMKMKPMREESLESFLRSDVNTEFIYIILLGIKHFFTIEDGAVIKKNKITIVTENYLAKINYSKTVDNDTMQISTKSF